MRIYAQTEHVKVLSPKFSPDERGVGIQEWFEERLAHGRIALIALRCTLWLPLSEGFKNADRQARIQSKCMSKLPAKFVDGVAGETARKKKDL